MPSEDTDAAHGPATQGWIALIGWTVLCFAVAAVGSAFPPDDWYRTLNKPSFAPPDWLFAPVWTLLFLMMAVSAWLVARRSQPPLQNPAICAFLCQLILNALWSGLFFGLHRPDLALIEIVILWGAILLTITLFRRRSRIAAWLLAPYLAWVSFATALNYGYWSLN
jgi:benzodiazapine receptor